MMHEILHVVLQHCLRGEDRDQERFNIACDIVVNSNILLENKKIGVNIGDLGFTNYLQEIEDGWVEF
jgi:predicted metal-dependent peptidase